jgi:hypothetical protein
MDPCLKGEVNKCLENSVFSWLLVAEGPAPEGFCACRLGQERANSPTPCPFMFLFSVHT